MATMLIGYDLNRPGQNYDDLFDEIKNLGTWWHCLDSTWLVNKTCRHWRWPIAYGPRWIRTIGCWSRVRTARQPRGRVCRRTAPPGSRTRCKTSRSCSHVFQAVVVMDDLSGQLMAETRTTRTEVPEYVTLRGVRPPLRGRVVP